MACRMNESWQARGQRLQQSTADGCSPDLFTTAVKKVKKAASTLPGLHHLAAAATLCLRRCWTEVCHRTAAAALCLHSCLTEVCHLAAAIKMIGLHGVETRECVILSAGRKTTFLGAPAEDGSPQL